MFIYGLCTLAYLFLYLSSLHLFLFFAVPLLLFYTSNDSVSFDSGNSFTGWAKIEYHICSDIIVSNTVTLPSQKDITIRIWCQFGEVLLSTNFSKMLAAKKIIIPTLHIVKRPWK